MGGTQITADDELFINPRVYRGAVCARVCVCTRHGSVCNKTYFEEYEP